MVVTVGVDRLEEGGKVIAQVPGEKSDANPGAGKRGGHATVTVTAPAMDQMKKRRAAGDRAKLPRE